MVHRGQARERSAHVVAAEVVQVKDSAFGSPRTHATIALTRLVAPSSPKLSAVILELCRFFNQSFFDTKAAGPPQLSCC